MAHAGAKLTLLGRQLLVERVNLYGWKPADAARAMGVSRQTAYKWLRRFREEGPDGLRDRSSAPRRCPHALSSLEVAAIVGHRLETLKGLIASPMTSGGIVRRSMASFDATASRGSASSTGRPARWCDMSATVPASCCTST